MSKRKAKDVVEVVLKNFPKSRNSDRDLIARVWYSYGMVLTQEQYNKIMEVPTPETITRIRRKLQEDGKYLADKDVITERDFKSHVLQQNAPNASANRLGELLE